MWYVGKLDILFHHTSILAVNSDWRLGRRVKGGFHIARGLDPKYSSVVLLISRTYGIVIELVSHPSFGRTEKTQGIREIYESHYRMITNARRSRSVGMWTTEYHIPFLVSFNIRMVVVSCYRFANARMESGMVVVRDTNAVISSVVAGLGTGAFYRAAAGLRSAAIAGVIGGVVVGLGVIAKQAQKRYVPI
ncbi:Mitochondrial import inner membrane translocase subunit TIM23-2 [Capsicum annuum]|nr:Mitochondrial import inner membrane translocase subunit TIM23-2 [Capsicum annuum]